MKTEPLSHRFSISISRVSTPCTRMAGNEIHDVNQIYLPPAIQLIKNAIFLFPELVSVLNCITRGGRLLPNSWRYTWMKILIKIYHTQASYNNRDPFIDDIFQSISCFCISLKESFNTCTPVANVAILIGMHPDRQIRKSKGKMEPVQRNYIFRILNILILHLNNFYTQVP